MSSQTFHRILSDKTSGSSELLIEINEYFKQNLNDLDLINLALDDINSKLHSFEAIMKYSENIQRLTAKGDLLQLKKYLDEFDEIQTLTYLKIYKNLMPILKNKKKAFTLSNSQTVYEILKLWYAENKSIEITIAESRPAFEGRILSKKLLKFGIGVRLITDNHIADYISKCDVILLGADKVLSNGDIVNKIGSKSAAIIAKYYKKPLVVIASEKKISRQKTFRESLKPSKEIWDFNHTKLKIANYYFEIVPRNLITKVITEKYVH